MFQSQAFNFPLKLLAAAAWLQYQSTRLNNICAKAKSLRLDLDVLE